MENEMYCLLNIKTPLDGYLKYKQYILITLNDYKDLKLNCKHSLWIGESYLDCLDEIENHSDVISDEIVIVTKSEFSNMNLIKNL